MLYLFALLLILLILALLAYLANTLIFALTMLRGAVYVPSSDDKITTIVKLAKSLKPHRIAELGSGDGRLCVALATTGAHIDGFEINPILVWRSRRLVARHHLTSRIAIHRSDFWSVNLSTYDLVIIYGTTYIMSRLARKLKQEFKPHAHVISNYFQLPSWKPLKSANEIRLYQLP